MNYTMEDIPIEKLLGRAHIDLAEADSSKIRDKIVLVTGGGGSIGSELCRQLAVMSPKKLIILDIYENNAYELFNELSCKYPHQSIEVLVGSVRDEKRIDYIFSEYTPQVVYHAAAHKHVPLMEASPAEAVKNNVFGTLNVVKAAHKYKAERFILISTDKAVNPTSVMGATKRVCEMIVAMMAQNFETKSACVRFGNVLGSNGSVIPLFLSQIKRGGPVTVTDAGIIRYFMTVSEAVSLVIKAGEYADCGEIFVLDMGAPVRIDELARNLIRLCGYEPDVDIPVVYTGIRAGEKLYEELLLSGEGLRKTENDLIYVGRSADINASELEYKLEELRNACGGTAEEVKRVLGNIVEEYKY